MGSKPAGGSPPAVKPVAAPVAPAKLPGVPVAASIPAGKPGLPAAPFKPAAPAAATPAAQAPAIASQSPVLVTLGQISAAWPDGIRREIATWQLETAQVGLPSAEVGSALRLGKVQFAWSAILQCLQDGSGAERQAATAFGSEVLDIPLQVIAPLFIASTRGTAPAARKKSFDDSIPDLFQQSPVAGPGASSPAPKNGGGTTHLRKPASPAQEPVIGPVSGPTLSVPMALVDESWSDLLKAQIARTRISGLKLDLPLDDVGRALKAGKIEYSWKQLRAWLSPALASDVGSDQNEKLLTLPLKVIAPLFLAQQKTQKPGAAKKGGLADDIPDLFFSASAPPAPAGPTTPPEASAPTPAPASEPEPVLAPAAPGEESFSTTRFIRKGGPADLGELFSQPGKTSWTPAEIVQNTARIKGVEGAIIAMHDGELVAAHLKSPWRPEATAAFIPQIFSRLEQYAKELDAGGLTHVMLTTEGGTLHVFNAGRIYFAVVGSAGSVDTVQMAPVRMIVSELSKHSQ